MTDSRASKEFAKAQRMQVIINNDDEDPKSQAGTFHKENTGAQESNTNIMEGQSSIVSGL